MIDSQIGKFSYILNHLYITIFGSLPHRKAMHKPQEAFKTKCFMNQIF